MKKIFFIVLLAFYSANIFAQTKNPLLEPFDTQHKVPPFDKIKTEHFAEAITKSIEEYKKEIGVIIANEVRPNFRNTIEAFEKSGENLKNILNIYYNLSLVCSSAEFQKVESEMANYIAIYSSRIYLNEALFTKIKEVYDKKDKLKLNEEQMALLEKIYKKFVRNGALLADGYKKQLLVIAGDIAYCSLAYKQNIQNSTDNFAMQVTDRAQIADLPPFMLGIAAGEAKCRGLEGWVFTLQPSCFGQFLKFSSNRELKEKIWKGYNSIAYKDRWDNSSNIGILTLLRWKYANILGYESYADYVLEERMAESVSNVNSFLKELINETLPIAKREYEDVVEFAKKSGVDFRLMPWDWTYYSDKYKNSLYSVSDRELRPYFEMNSVLGGVFSLIERLYGVKFVENSSLPKYNGDVKSYEIYDGKRLLAILYLDIYSRKGKSSGAWVSNYRDMYYNVEGKEIRPVISLIVNFAKPADNSPLLLTYMDVHTLLHEMGHVTHSLFAEGRYASLTGTSVARDFVELPSQIMENWASRKEFYQMWAHHHITGEKMPEQLIDNLIKSNNFQKAYKSMRQLALASIDMSVHTLHRGLNVDIEAFEKECFAPTQILDAIDGVCNLASFSHIFDGGYASGYYSYKWSELLSIDAFALFEKNGVFDTTTAQSFRANVLSKGSIGKPMDLYINYRGAKPNFRSLKPILQ